VFDGQLPLGKLPLDTARSAEVAFALLEAGASTRMRNN
jgi:hypothetical protein